MTNINCSSNCIYQEDGKCMMNNIQMNPIFDGSDCIYYKENSSTSKSDQEILKNIGNA